MSDTALTRGEASRLADLERAIERSYAGFLDVGNALAEIREGRLYRQGYPTFEAYLKDRWGMGRHYASRLIQAVGAVRGLEPIGTVLPANEAQARELARVEPARRQEVWEQAVAAAGGAAPTAALVRDAAGLLTAEDLDEDSAARLRELEANEAAAAESSEEAAEESAESDRARRVEQGLRKIGEAKRKFAGVEGGYLVVSLLERAEQQAGTLGEGVIDAHADPNGCAHRSQ